MNPRERMLVFIIGGAVAIGLAYKLVNVALIEPYRSAKDSIVKLEADSKRLDALIASRPLLARRWLDLAERTFSFERSEAQAGFGKELKEIAKRNGFDGANFTTSTGTKIGERTNITTVAHSIVIDGKYEDAVRFLRDLYATPFLSQITKLAVSPVEGKGIRGRVKVELTIESPLLPQIRKDKMPQAADARTFDPERAEKLGLARSGLRGDAFYRTIENRNIFRAYLAPPENVVLIDNQDRKTVAVKVVFHWDGKPNEQRLETVAGRSTLTVKGKGGEVEVTGSYADGETFGPRRLTFVADRKQDWTVVVDSHTPPPPPTVVDLAVENRHLEPMQVDVLVTMHDGQQRKEPTMLFQPGVADVREYVDIQSVRVSATYPSGKPARVQTFSPAGSKQTYVIEPEPLEAVTMDEPPPDVADPPPDPSLTVTGLVYYPDPVTPEQLTQEMIVSASGVRSIVRVGEAGAVDGGMLVAIVPTLGGVVKMPETGNYYIYPLGRTYASRVKLQARSENDLPAAIDAWTSR